MSTTSLTRKYRPQRFEEVAGQEAVKRILSRAAGEDRVAPAYLFSGTRGVGKTTLARIFAKALNCESAPAAEPCNVCAQCRQITAGVSPDVVEIDAATHGGVDEARRLKEDVGYAPLQSRYKVFIIDEAHMLSKAAFNALLKTLEEPPGRVTFVLATTEPHKFPATIISRCQHFIFKRMTQAELEGHLENILSREGLEFERGAVTLIAKRGAGSVRDSMSLLGQSLALGGSRLTETDVRGVLGLAGQEVFFGLAEAIHGQDCLAAADILRQVLDKGLDIGFFLRELTGMWRNLFLLRQAGEAAFPLADLGPEEAREWLGWARKFDLTHIHACWQMTLEGQRRVMTSLEPALALELLVLNLVYLPRLLSLDAARAALPAGPGRSGPGPATGPAGASGPRGGFAQRPGPRPAPRSAPSGGSGPPVGGWTPPSEERPPARPAPAPASRPGPFSEGAPAAPSYREPAVPAQPASPSAFAGSPPAAPRGPRSWEGFLAHYEARKREGFGGLPRFETVRGRFEESENLLVLSCPSQFLRDQLRAEDNFRRLSALALEYFGPGADVRLDAGGASPRPDTGDVKAYVNERPEVRRAMAELGAEVLEVRPRLDGGS